MIDQAKQWRGHMSRRTGNAGWAGVLGFCIAVLLLAVILAVAARAALPVQIVDMR